MPGPPSSRIRLLGREDGYDRELQWEEGLGVPSGREGHGAGPKETIIKEVNMDKGSELHWNGKTRTSPAVWRPKLYACLASSSWNCTEAPSIQHAPYLVLKLGQNVAFSCAISKNRYLDRCLYLSESWLSLTVTWQVFNSLYWVSSPTLLGQYYCRLWSCYIDPCTG